MNENHGEIDLDKARLDPGSVFSNPEELMDYPGMTREQKIEILTANSPDAELEPYHSD